MPPKTNRQVVIAGIPTDRLQVSHYKMSEAQVPEPAEGQVLVRTLLVSMDPIRRSSITGKPGGMQIGDVMTSSGLAQIVKSRTAGFSEGQVVECFPGWQEYALQKPADMTTFSRLGPLTHHLSVYGVSGLTGYFGMSDVGAPGPGDTVLVSAAGGAVGHIAGQVAKIRGAKVVGIVSSPEKAAWLTGTLGYDAAIDRRAGPLLDAIKQTCPKGIDIYFDNVGGEVLETVMTRMKQHGRIVLCGWATQYDTQSPDDSLKGVSYQLVYKRLRMEGFVVNDYYDRKAQARAELAGWVKSGEMKVAVDCLDGLERTPEAFVGLFNGDNRGKRMVKVADEV